MQTEEDIRILTGSYGKGRADVWCGGWKLDAEYYT